MQLIGKMFEKIFIQQLTDYYPSQPFIQQISKTGEINKRPVLFVARDSCYIRKN